jgi:hypothetical protein
MKQERYTGHRIAKRSLIIAGRDTEIAVPFDALAQIIEALSQELPIEPRRSHETAAVGWSGSRQRNWLDFVKQEQPHAEL